MSRKPTESMTAEMLRLFRNQDYVCFGAEWIRPRLRRGVESFGGVEDARDAMVSAVRGDRASAETLYSLMVIFRQISGTAVSDDIGPGRMIPVCEQMLSEGYLKLSVDVYLNPLLDTITAEHSSTAQMINEPLRRQAAAVMQSLGMCLSKSRAMRQGFIDSGAYHLIASLIVDKMPGISTNGLMLAAMAVSAGKLLPKFDRFAAARLLKGALKIGMGDDDVQEGIYGGYSVFEASESIAALCADETCRAALIAEDVLPDVVRSIVLLKDNVGVKDKEGLLASCAALSRLAMEQRGIEWILSNNETMMPLLEHLRASEDTRIKSYVLSVLFQIDPENESVREAFNEAVMTGSARWNKSQILLVGQGRAGKSGFLNSLMNRIFCETESTIGMAGMTCEISTLASAKSWLCESKGGSGEGELSRARAQLAARACSGKKLQHSSSYIHNIEEDILPLDGESAHSSEPGTVISSSSRRVNMREHPTGKEEVDRGHAGIQRLEQDLIMEFLRDDETHEQISFEAWDFGGQDVFYSLHHLFLTAYGVYCVLFNMEWFRIPEDVEKTLVFLEFWLSSIYLHTQTKLGGCAPIILVGTHKDKVEVQDEHARISSLLTARFSERMALTAWKGVHQYEDAPGGSLCFFPVDNTIGQSDPAVTSSMRVLESVAKGADYIQQEVPLAWLGFYDKIKSISETCMCVSFDKAKEMAKECGLPISPKLGLEREVTAVLTFFNKLGKLMYHNDHSLSSIVVLKPVELLIPSFTRIICDHTGLHRTPETIQAARDYPAEWRMLVDRATLDTVLLKILWKDFQEQSAVLLQLMHTYGLIVPLSDADREGRELFLVPSLLEDKGPLQPPQQSSNMLSFYLVYSLDAPSSDTDLVVGFKDVFIRFLPIGFFLRLLGKSVSWGQSTRGKRAAVSKKWADLSFGINRFSMEEIMDTRCVRVKVHGQNPKGILRVLEKLSKEVIAECMPKLKCMVMIPSQQEEEEPTYLVDLGQLLSRRKTWGEGVWIGDERLNDVRGVEQRFGAWVGTSGLREQGYDVFFSYRQGNSDSSIVEMLCDCMSCESVGENGRSIEVFWDRIRLQVGRMFDEDFMNAMFKSLGVSPILSLDALGRMVMIEDGSEMDNVLLEWVLALEILHIKGPDAFFILPIMFGKIGNKPGDAPIGNLFSEKVIERLPEVKPYAVIDRVREFLTKMNLQPSNKLEDRTVKGIVQELSKSMGILAWDLVTGHGGCSSISNTSNLYETSCKEIVACINRVIKDSPLSASFNSSIPDKTLFEEILPVKPVQIRSLRGAPRCDTQGDNCAGGGKAEEKLLKERDEREKDQLRAEAETAKMQLEMARLQLELERARHAKGGSSCCSVM